MEIKPHASEQPLSQRRNRKGNQKLSSDKWEGKYDKFPEKRPWLKWRLKTYLLKSSKQWYKDAHQLQEKNGWTQ